MDNQNLLQRGTSEERMRSLARSADVLSKYFRSWARGFPNQPIGRDTVAFYLEALSDLSPEQIESGCREAIKTAEVFPKPGHIRSAIPFDETLFLGPRQLTYPEVTQQERDEALKFSEALASVIQKERAKYPPTKTAAAIAKKLNIPPTRLTLEQQKEILRKKGYL